MVAYKDLYLKYKSKYLNSGGSQEDYSTHSMNAPDDVPAKKGQFVTQQSGGARLPPQPLVSIYNETWHYLGCVKLYVSLPDRITIHYEHLL